MSSLANNIPSRNYRGGGSKAWVSLCTVRQNDAAVFKRDGKPTVSDDIDRPDLYKRFAFLD